MLDAIEADGFRTVHPCVSSRRLGFYYLATPYSKYPGGIEAAFALACDNAAVLIKAGIPVYSPIAHTHPIVLHGAMNPLDHSIWLPADAPMMDAACGLIVLQAESWTESYGMKVEIARFRDARKAIIYMEPGRVPLALRR